MLREKAGERGERGKLDRSGKGERGNGERCEKERGENGDLEM